MKVAVFSDSHGKINSIINAIDAEMPDAIIHLGDYAGDAHDLKNIYEDIPVYNVLGNNDYYTCNDPETAIIHLDGVKILICHGHTFNVHKSTYELRKYAEDSDVSVAMYGHTHIADIHMENDILIINPGSISLPRSGNPSYVIFDSKENKTKLIHLDK